MSKPIALITGASRGIGRAIALRLCAQHDIVAVARAQAELDRLRGEVEAAGGACRTIALDVADGPAVARALTGLRADVLINNAGVGALKPFLELTPEEWHRQVDVNFNALYHVTRAVLPGMVERQSGHVVIIGSVTGRSAFVGGSCYAATKHAVSGFAECLMLEVRDHGVKVSVVNPASTATEFGGGSPADKPWALRPEDVAETVAHVLSTPPNVLVFTAEVRALSPRR